MSEAPDKYPLLTGIASPADLRRLPAGKLPALVQELRDTAIGALAPLGHRSAALVQLANFVVNRAS